MSSIFVVSFRGYTSDAVYRVRRSEALERRSGKSNIATCRVKVHLPPYLREDFRGAATFRRVRASGRAQAESRRWNLNSSANAIETVSLLARSKKEQAPATASARPKSNDRKHVRGLIPITVGIITPGRHHHAHRRPTLCAFSHSLRRPGEAFGVRVDGVVAQGASIRSRKNR